VILTQVPTLTMIWTKARRFETKAKGRKLKNLGRKIDELG